MLDKCCCMFSTKNMVLCLYILCFYVLFRIFDLWTNLELIKFASLFLCLSLFHFVCDCLVDVSS